MINIIISIIIIIIIIMFNCMFYPVSYKLFVFRLNPNAIKAKFSRPSKKDMHPPSICRAIRPPFNWAHLTVCVSLSVFWFRFARYFHSVVVFGV